MLLSRRLRTLLNNLPRSRKNGKCRGSFEEQVASLNLASTLGPLFDELDPKPGFLRIWPDKVWVVSTGVCPLLSAATDK